MYDPVKYWSKRKKPNPYNHVRGMELYDLKPFIDKAGIILDYGVGNGRLMPLYTGKSVYGIDIVFTYRDECIENARKNDVNFTWSREFWGEYDLGVCTKVLLHEPNPKPIINELAKRCKKVFISTALGNTSRHCFDHDYEELLKGYNIEYWQEYGRELYVCFS